MLWAEVQEIRWSAEYAGKTGNMKENAEVYLVGSGGGVVAVLQSSPCPLKVRYPQFAAE